MKLNLKSKISVWNRMNMDDIKASIACKPHIIHISVPVSDILITHKLGKDRDWVIENMKRCVAFAANRGFEVTLGLEDASRTDFAFLEKVVEEAAGEGVKRFRYADTVGILHRQRTFEEVEKLLKDIHGIEIEMHAHNDLGMAVSNSVSAVRGGAGYIDCTMGGIGERAGNCNFLEFIIASRAILGVLDAYDIKKILKMQKAITKMIKGKTS